MSILKSNKPKHLFVGCFADIIDASSPGGPFTALHCRIEIISEDGTATCVGLKVVDEFGSDVTTFSHNDKNIMAVINRVGERFKVDQSILHPTV